MSIMRDKLQLVGVTAIYIAAKFEEVFPPELTDFAYITDDTYTKSQVGATIILSMVHLSQILCEVNSNT